MLYMQIHIHKPWKATQIHAHKHLYSASKAVGEAGLQAVGRMLISHPCVIAPLQRLQGPLGKSMPSNVPPAEEPYRLLYRSSAVIAKTWGFHKCPSIGSQLNKISTRIHVRTKNLRQKRIRKLIRRSILRYLINKKMHKNAEIICYFWVGRKSSNIICI